MIRWRCALVLAMLLLLPATTNSKEEDEQDDDGDDESEEEGDDEDEEEDEESMVQKDERVTARRSGVANALVTMKPITITRTAKLRPLECFVCVYKSETPLRACLDPTKYRVHTITCHSVDDRCFTSVITKGESYEAVIRGCRSGCVGSSETTCCELNRCNHQVFGLPNPTIEPRAAAAQLTSQANKPLPPFILFFVTVLLVLQTVVKVAFV